ncbi:rve domain-containing [Abeliophyllum distichum]|uniref:Rve domain-containing n=1 Tax=Abeliophyllum distichum TaxID=126358 RepID=A0ABD1V4Z7_9LAMI
MEKLTYALIMFARKLRPYFLQHPIEVLSNYPLRQVLQKPDTSGRLVKWAVELGQFELHYKPRTAIKGQALADFIAEFSPEHEPSVKERGSLDPLCRWLVDRDSGRGQSCPDEPGPRAAMPVFTI